MSDDKTKVVRKNQIANTLMRPQSNWEQDFNQDEPTDPQLRLAPSEMSQCRMFPPTVNMSISCLSDQVEALTLRENEYKVQIAQYVEHQKNLILQNTILWIACGILSALAAIGILYMLLQ